MEDVKLKVELLTCKSVIIEGYNRNIRNSRLFKHRVLCPENTYIYLIHHDPNKEDQKQVSWD